MKRKIGRPKKAEKILVAVRLERDFAELVQTAKDRKGLEQGPYMQTLMTIADKMIPNKPKLVIRATLAKAV